MDKHINFSSLDADHNIDPTRKAEEFYKRLRGQLEDNHNFPENYIFKFIFKNEQKKLVELYRIFDEVRHTFSTKESKKGNYISCTISAFVLDAEHVIRLYQKTATIEGVIML